MITPGATGTVEDQISAAIVRFGSESLPETVWPAASDAVLDWLGCAIGGSRSDLAHALEVFVRDELAPAGVATLFLAGHPTATARTAAFVNGALSHVLELDDIFAEALYHPGVCVVPAALASAQAVGATGETLLRAVVAGYEISNRLGAAVNPEHYRLWHTTGTIGTIGAAAAASVALGLNQCEAGWAIGNAATMAAGLKQAFKSDGMTNPLHAGRAAEGGVTAALLARSAFTGSTGMISGPSGLAAAMAGGADLSGAFATLFEDWTVTRPTLKRFASCGHTFAPIDMALDIKERHKLSVDRIRDVGVVTYSAAIEAAGITSPVTPFEARFSIAFCVAAAIMGQDISDPSTFETAVRDEDIQALCRRIAVMPGAAFDASFPAMRGASVSIRLTDGRVLEAEAATRKGAPENPLSAEEIAAKAERLIARGGCDAKAWVSWARTLVDAETVGPCTMPAIRG